MVNASRIFSRSALRLSLFSAIALFGSSTLSRPATLNSPTSPPRALREGAYRFSGEIEAIGRIRKEVIHSATPEGRARVSQLKSEGFECRRVVSNRDLCSKKFWGESIPDDVKARLRQDRYRWGDVSLGQLTGDPSLLSAGDVAVEWEFPQSLSFAGRASLSHRRLIASAVEKIRSGDLASGLGTEFVVRFDEGTGATSLHAMISTVRSKGDFSDEFIGFAVYRPLLP